MMTILVELFALGVAFVIGLCIRRYFILTSGESKTNLPFIKDYSFMFGSKDIIFSEDKVLALKSHDWHEKLGDTFGCYFGQNMQIFTRDPDLIYKVCVTEFNSHRNRYNGDSMSNLMKASLLEAKDQAWQSSRRAVGSVLKVSKLKMDNVDNVVDHEIGEMLQSIEKRIREAKAKGEDTVMDVYQINKNFFMQSILRIVFNTHDMVDFDKERNEVVEEMYNFVCVNYESVCRVCFLIPILTNMVRPFLGFFDYGKYLGKLQVKLERIIGETVKGVQERREQNSRLTTIHSLISAYRRGDLSREELMGNAIFIMFASFVTSVDTMSALLFELAHHPEVQDKLRRDLMQYGEESQYLEQCINETLRLYPGALTNRTLTDHVYHKDYRLPNQSSFNLSIYSLHHDRKLWGDDVEEFKPERFEPSKMEKFHPAQFIPFSIGPRNCPGYHLVRLELRKYTSQLMTKYKLEVCDRSDSEIQSIPLGCLPYALPVKGPMYFRLVPVNESN